MVSANLLENGGFEQPDLCKPHCISWRTYESIPGWTLTRSHWFEFEQYHTPAEGHQYLALSAFEPGTIIQGFDTTPGYTYNLSFEFSPQPGTHDNVLAVGLSNIAAMDVNTILDTIHGHGTDDLGYAIPDTAWSTYSYDFTPTNSKTFIWFDALVTDAHQVLLDNVSVELKTTNTNIPEPSTLLLLGAGLGGVGLMRRRFK